MFRTIWVHLGPFGCLTELGAKQAEQVQHIGIFLNEHTRSTPLDPKLTFWCVSYYLGAFGTIWLPHKTRCKTCRTSAKVRARKWLRNFSQQTHPIHPIGPLTDVLVRFVLFGCLGLFGCLTKLGAKRAELVQKVHAMKSRRNFSQRTHRIHPIRP